MTGAWGAVLGSTYLSGGTPDTNLLSPACSGLSYDLVGCLTKPPAGLDQPDIRTEDEEYYQRDGVKHFSDWLGPRFVTFEQVKVCSDSCSNCGGEGSARKKIQMLMQDWKRTCCDTELVLFTDCHLADHADNYNLPDQDGTWTEVGENRAPNPSAETEERWDSNDGDITVSWDTTVFYAGTKSVRSEKTSGTDSIVLALTDVGATDADEVEVEDGKTYTFSIWLMAEQDGYVGELDVDWPGAGLEVGTQVPLPAGVWTRVTVTGVADGTGAASVQPYILTPDLSPATVGDVGYADALLVEESDVLHDYYDGDTDDVYDPATETWYRFTWTGDADESTTLKESQAATFHGSAVNGPFGIVGRPRVALYNWDGGGVDCATALLRFDGVDHRIYVLDECGTPGYTNCIQINPGTQQFTRCYEDGTRCYSAAGRCYSNPVTTDDSVEPTTISVGGTERVFPTITLYPPLVSPYVELMNSAEYVQLDATLVEGDSPVTIYTETGEAFDQEGNSLSDLLRGNLILSMEPGNYDWRVLSASSQDEENPGYATLCWRDTVMNA